MTNTSRQLPSAPSESKRALPIGGAWVLILVGLLLQIGALGYGHFNLGTMWAASVIGKSAWSMLNSLISSPTMQDVAIFWPLALVTIGLASLVVRRLQPNFDLGSHPQGGQEHGK